MKKNKTLTPEDVKAGDLMIEIPVEYKRKGRRFFFIKEVKVKEYKVTGVYLEELLEDITLLSPEKKPKHVFGFNGHCGSAVVVFSIESGRKYLSLPTQEQVKIVKKQLREKLEQYKEKIGKLKHSSQTTKKMDATHVMEHKIQNMNPVFKYGVYFREKSLFQKDDCITYCGRESTLEAVYLNSMVRCCTNQNCQKHAAKWAKIIGEKE